MMKAIGLALVLAFGVSTLAQAAEGCGENRWKDEYGHCHWFKNPNGTDRGTTHACPTWAHWSGGRCVPN
jgi:hypothetical protein